MNVELSNQILTLSDFCAEYLQGNHGYILKGPQLHKYHSILSNLIEFSNSKLIIVNYPNFPLNLIDIDRNIEKNIEVNAIGSKFDREVLRTFNANKFIYLYSIDGGYKKTNTTEREIMLRFYATNELPSIKYTFNLKTDETLNSIENKLSGLSIEQLKEINYQIEKMEHQRLNSVVTTTPSINAFNLPKGWATYLDGKTNKS